MSNDKRITIMCQGKVDYTVEGFAVNGMLAIPKDEDGVAYVTRAQAMDFFDLVHGGECRVTQDQLVKEVEAFLQRTPGAVRVCEGGGPENLAASFAVTLHNVLHERVVRDLVLELTHVTLAIDPSMQADAYNVVHKVNAKPIGVIYKEVDGYFVFAPATNGYWDGYTLGEISFSLHAMNKHWHAQVMSDPAISNG